MAIIIGRMYIRTGTVILVMAGGASARVAGKMGGYSNKQHDFQLRLRDRSWGVWGCRDDPLKKNYQWPAFVHDKGLRDLRTERTGAPLAIRFKHCPENGTHSHARHPRGAYDDTCHRRRRLPGIRIVSGRSPHSDHPGSALSRSRSAASFRTITVSQKGATALQSVSSVSIAATTLGRERSCPILLTRIPRSAHHAEHCSSVCCLESRSHPQWWHCGVGSSPFLLRYSPKQPCPVSTWANQQVVSTKKLSGSV